jgi:hypothetical protein
MIIYGNPNRAFVFRSSPPVYVTTPAPRNLGFGPFNA